MWSTISPPLWGNGKFCPVPGDGTLWPQKHKNPREGAASGLSQMSMLMHALSISNLLALTLHLSFGVAGCVPLS